MAKKEFTAESGLGFMRFIQFMNILTIIIILIFMLGMTGQKTTMSFTLFQLIFYLVSRSIVVWLIAKRKKNTRFVAPAIFWINCVFSLITYVLIDTLDVAYFLSEVIPPAFMTVYFLTSRRAKAVLVQPFDVKRKDKDLEDQTKMWNPRSLDFWLRLLIYFFAFSILGHWMEMGVQILVVNGLFPGTVASADSLTWRDSFTPFFIYGIAVAFCGLALFPIYVKLKEKIPNIWLAFIASFLVNTAFCVAAELILGFAFNQDYSAWDYRDQFLNFQGQICFLYTLAFGVASSVITWLVYPFMEKHLGHLSRDMFRVVFLGSTVLFIIIFVLYAITPTQAGLDSSMATKIQEQWEEISD